jgi:hypothetical protein
MSEGERKFRYRLEALIRLRAAERDALKTALERAAEEVERRSRACEAVARAIELAESELRALYRDGADLPLDGQLRLQLYLKQQRAIRTAKQREVDEASRAMHLALSELELKLQDTKALESHRERKRQQFDEIQARAAMHTADEQWLRLKRDDT